MSVELLNDCVVFPHMPNWKTGVKWGRDWATEVASGVTGAEDRASGRSVPLERLDITFLTESRQERSRLTARILDALKRGRACCPFWGRGVEIREDATRKDAVMLRESRQLWNPCDFVFFLSPPTSKDNASLRINCGGVAVASGNWLADQFYSGGGTGSAPLIHTPAEYHPVKTSPITVIDENGIAAVADEPAPELVYQTWRKLDSVTPALPITYTFQNLSVEDSYLIRLHFAEIQTFGYHDVWQTISVIGSTTQTRVNVRPGTDYGEFTALIREFRATPDSNGTIKVEILGVASERCLEYHAFINAVELHRVRWETRGLDSGTNAGRLKWQGRLKGKYPVGSLVYPVLFGTPRVNDLEAITNWHGNISVSVREPLGKGALGTPGQCPVEVCSAPVGFDFPLFGGQGFDPALNCSGGGSLSITSPWQHYFHSGGPLCAGNQQAPGKVGTVGAGSNPNNHLDLGLITWWKGVAEQSLIADRTAAGKVITDKKFYWKWITQTSGWDIVYYYTYLPDGGFACSQPAAWTLSIKFCERDA